MKSFFIIKRASFAIILVLLIASSRRAQPAEGDPVLGVRIAKGIAAQGWLFHWKVRERPTPELGPSLLI